MEKSRKSNSGVFGENDTVVRTSKRLNVCYSMHPSLQEVVDVINHLRPKIVTPLVKPVGAESITEVRDIEIILKHGKGCY